MLSASKLQRLHQKFCADARSNFYADSRLEAALLLFDDRGNMFPFMLVSDTASVENINSYKQQGITPVPHSWRRNIPFLTDQARKHHIVAGTLIGEMWLASGPNAAEVMSMGIDVSAHPMRIEATFVSTLCPRSEFNAIWVAEIVRERNSEEAKLATLDNWGGDSVLQGWLNTLLRDVSSN